MTDPYLIDPITPLELSRAVTILRDDFHGIRLRFKFADLYECPRRDVIPYLECERLGMPLPPPPDRRAGFTSISASQMFPQEP
jgi:primary-amine oxidase